MITIAPVLTTPHLILRGHTVADYDRLAAMWADPVVIKHIGGRASTAQEAWFRLLRYMGHWPALGYGYWAVCDRESGLYIGDVGLADHKRGMHPEFDGTPEAGWVITPAMAGRGLATEATQAILDWCEASYGRTRTVCMIESVHAGSIRVATKLGYERFAEVAMPAGPVSVFQRF
jgi:RimJ/RimL family protein N-acetyltransferase